MLKPTSTLGKFFLRGLGILLPIALTIYIVYWLWNFLSVTIFGRIESAVLWAVELYVKLTSEGELTSEEIRDSASRTLPDPLRFWFSMAITLLLIILVGWWLSGFIGRRVSAAFDRILTRTPLIGAIYPYVKQVTDFFFGQERKVEFERVVAVPYPRIGVYSLAFLTGSSLQSLNRACGDELISVFVPSSPMPATGYTLFVPARDIVPMKLSVEEALRTVISGGVLVPASEAVTPSEQARALAGRSKVAPALIEGAPPDQGAPATNEPPDSPEEET